jgi:PAS domain S-box-containing protein
MQPLERRRRGPAQATVARLLAATVALVVTMAVLVALLRERQLTLVQSRQDAATLAAALEENTARTFDSVDIALVGLAAHLAEHRPPRNDGPTRQLMRIELRHLPTVRALFVIGPDGVVQQHTDDRAPNVSLADRPYFRAYLEQPGLQHSLSGALQSRSGAGWFIASSRRITRPDGQFGGIVVAAVQLDSLSTLYRKLGLSAGQQMSLLHTDGRLVARHPPDDANIGRSYADQIVFTRYLPHAPSGVFEASGPPFGYARIVSYRALQSQPLVVVFGIRKDAALAPWARTVAGALGGLVVFYLSTAAGLLFFLQRQTQRQRARADRLAAQEATALAEANAKFRTFFEQGSFFSCVLGTDGSVVEANDTGLATFGYARHDAVGRKFWQCPWWGDSQVQQRAVQDGLAEAVRGTTFKCETAYRRADGTHRLVDLVMSPIHGDRGAVLSVAAVAVDVTDHRHQEEQLRELATELASADRRKSRFLAMLSHELRNALGPIQNGLHVIGRAAGGSPQVARAHGIVQSQVTQMRRLVEDLLDVSRVNSGKVRLEFERFDLRHLLADAAAAGQAFMEGPRHQLDTDWPDEPLDIRADRARLLQVVTNLLSNAAKYTPPGGHIRLAARREGDMAIVDVSDDGMGIPVAAQARVFEMFEQLDNTLSRAQGGLGIGLALVQRLVALHGGHVEVFSEGEGQGSTFSVFLPLATHAQGEDAQAVTVPGGL